MASNFLTQGLDLQQEMKRKQDSITDLLRNRSKPTFGDIGSSVVDQAIAVSPTRMKQGYKPQAASDFAAASTEQELRPQLTELQFLQDTAKQGAESSKMLLDTVGKFTNDPQEAAKLVAYLNEIPENVNDTNIVTLTARGAKQLGLGKPKGPAPTETDRLFALAGFTPEEKKAYARATLQGKMTGMTPKEMREAEAAASQKQGAVDMARSGLNTLLSVKNNPKLSGYTGANAIIPVIPGTENANIDAKVKQLQGQSFLKAFESLKGGGQITQVEGEKATEAITRLQRSQTDEAYVEALTELEGLLKTGIERAGGDVSDIYAQYPTAGAKPDAQSKSGRTAVINGKQYYKENGQWYER